MGRTAAIIAQGEEILAGSTLDTNSQWLAAELFNRGIRVRAISAAPDDEVALAHALRVAAREADIVVCSGGLGPTDDDCTAAAVGRAVALPLVEHAEALAQVEARFRAAGWPMPPSNRKQALLPRGAMVLENQKGTAPGFALDLGRARGFFFPGVPRELTQMVAEHLWPWLEALGQAPRLRTRLHVCGVGESALQDRLGDLALPAGVELGYKTWLPYNSVVLYAEADDPQAARQLVQARESVRTLLGVDCFGADEETLPEVLGAALRARGWTLALAESCTAGGAAALVTEAAGSSDYFLGGVVSYANAVKRGALGVPEAVLTEHGAVSEPCARAMAEGARRALGADVGVSITGVAGPGGGSVEKPVGMVCFGLATPQETRARTVRFGDRGREAVRGLAAASAIEWLRRRLTADA